MSITHSFIAHIVCVIVSSQKIIELSRQKQKYFELTTFWWLDLRLNFNEASISE